MKATTTSAVVLAAVLAQTAMAVGSEQSNNVETLQRRLLTGECTFQQTNGKYTVGGRQLKASNTHTCNTTPSCKFPAAVTVTEGRSLEPKLNRDFFSIIGEAVGQAFLESKPYDFKSNFSQGAGTTGYMSFIPTLNCWKGTFETCFESSNGVMFLLDPKTEYTACTPALLSGGEIDGTLSFVYVQS